MSFTYMGVILDLDGVIWLSGKPAKSAASFIHALRRVNFPFCFLTNDCSVSKAERRGELASAGLAVGNDELVMVAEVTNAWLKSRDVHTIMYLGAQSVLSEVAKGLCLRWDDSVNAVVVGDVFKHYDRGLLDSAVKAIFNGAILVAMHRNRLWSDGQNWYIDNGFWVAGFEYVTGRQAYVTGKPNKDAYLMALTKIGLAAQELHRIAFVSDDILIDLQGAKKVGLCTIYMGTERNLPSWIDYTVKSLDEVMSLLTGENE